MRGRQPLLLAAEVGLVLVTLAAVLGMQRLFADGGWLAPLTLNAVAAHATAALARRRGLTLPTSGLLLAAAAAIVTTWTFYWSTTRVGLPTGRTWSAMSDDLSGAWELYQDVVAPAPVQRGFLLASALALWCIAYVADWAAFRLWVPFEASLPAGTLFLFTALLGADAGRSWAVGLYAGSLLAFMLLHRIARQGGSSHWVAERGPAGHRALLTAGAGLTLVAVVAGSMVGSSLPGAGEPGMLDPRSLRSGSDARVTISPLVDIQTRLVEQAQVEVFQVRSPQRSYWRLTSLDRFDGQIWASSGDFGRASGPLPTAVEADTATEVFEQRFTISALSAIWLPTAYEPRALDVSSVVVRYDDESSTLIVDNDVSTSDGLTYQVTSASPRLASEDLEGFTGEVPDDIAREFLDLPDDFSPEVVELARQLTAEAETPAAQALALQDHLRQFTYDLGVGPGHSGSALETFLFETQRGYCEQFSGSFAAMARAIGLPARVAVGFTTGDVDPADPELFTVRGEHAHAWPEVFIAGAGWVAYEPTPGRGMPFADHTGIPEQQAATSDPSTATTGPPSPTATLPSLPTDTTPSRVPDGALDTGAGPDASDAETASDGPLGVLSLLRALAPLALIAGLSCALYLVGFPLFLLARRHRRWRQALSPRDRVGLAWAEAVEAAALVGYRERLSDTHPARASQLAGLLPDAAGPGARLADLVESAMFSADGVSDDDGAEAMVASAAVVGAAEAAATRSARVLRWLDPRPLLTSARTRRVLLRRRITTTVRGDLEVERELVGSGDRR